MSIMNSQMDIFRIKIIKIPQNQYTEDNNKLEYEFTEEKNKLKKNYKEKKNRIEQYKEEKSQLFQKYDYLKKNLALKFKQFKQKEDKFKQYIMRLEIQKNEYINKNEQFKKKCSEQLYISERNMKRRNRRQRKK